MIYIGIDPGKKGGYAFVADDGDGAEAYAWDDDGFVGRMKALAREHRCVACVEKVGAMKGQGVTSMFTFGKSAGFIEGVLTGLGIPYQLIPPATWKREFSLIGKDKRASIVVCKKLFPDVDLKATNRCRKDSDGMAESLLMALYAKRHL